LCLLCILLCLLCIQSILFLHPKMSNLTIYYQNVRGLRTKTLTFLNNCLTNNFDIICLTETWLTDGIFDHELFDHRYVVYRRDRDYVSQSKKLGGGVLIAVKSDLNSSHQPAWSSHAEDIWISINLNSPTPLHICCSYHPQGPTHSSTLQLFLDNVSNIHMKNYNDLFLLVGDFNLPHITWIVNPTSSILLPHCTHPNLTSSLLLDFLSFSNMSQFNSQHNILDRILDLVIGNTPDCIISPSLSPFVPEDTHHKPIVISLNLPSFNLPKRIPIEIHLFNKADYVSICNHLSDINWEIEFLNLDINVCIDKFYKIIFNLIDSYVPKMIINHSKKFPIFYTKYLIKITKEKLKFHNRWKRFHSPSDYESFSLLRKRQKSLSKLCFSNYIISIENSIKRNANNFWHYVKSKRQTDQIPNSLFFNNITASDDLSKSNLFNDYFNSVFIHTSPPDPCFDNLPSFDTINSIYLDPPLVLKYLSTLDTNKGAGPDKIHPLFIKSCASQLCYPMFILFKLSLTHGTFPTLWKTTIITPIFKSGDIHNVCNYRPISKLSCFGKLLEKIVTDQLSSLLRKYIIPNQHGFLSKKSVETNLLHFTNFITRSMEDNCQTDTIYTDFSKAFDKISHSILIHKLRNVGIHGDLHRWLSSYITNRSQAVKINNKISGFKNVPSGVPQGSHLGPLLFLLYINDINSCFSHSSFLLFADDTKIFKKISSVDDCLMLQHDLDKFSNYCSSNQLFLNISKCSHISFSRLRSPIVFTYSIDNLPIIKVNTVRDLGVIFDTKLSFNTHIELIARRAYRNLGFIMRVSKPFKSHDTLILLYNSFVRSHLEFASTVWNPFYKHNINRLNKVQKRFLSYLHYKFSLPINSNPMLAHIKIPLETRRIIIDLCLLYKLLNNLVDSPYLLSKIFFNCPPRTLRNPNLFHLKSSTSNFSNNSFTCRACKAFNNLPISIDILFSSFPTFKISILKHFSNP
jgi:Reverse transcriptase (RNA-dependent DNA polymerase)